MTQIGCIASKLFASTFKLEFRFPDQNTCSRYPALVVVYESSLPRPLVNAIQNKISRSCLQSDDDAFHPAAFNTIIIILFLQLPGNMRMYQGNHSHLLHAYTYFAYRILNSSTPAALRAYLQLKSVQWCLCHYGRLIAVGL
jgi:hypothetical protein